MVSVVCYVSLWWESNIVIGLYILDMWSVLFVMYVGGMVYYIVIGLYILDMWSVLCVMYVGGGSTIVIDNNTLNCTYWTCGQCCLLCMRVVCSNIVIGLYILDMWSVLCVPYVGGGV